MSTGILLRVHELQSPNPLSAKWLGEEWQIPYMDSKSKKIKNLKIMQPSIPIANPKSYLYIYAVARMMK